MMRKIFVLMTMLALCLNLAQGAWALNGREIMEKVDARDDGDNMTARQEFLLLDRNGFKRTKTTKAFSKDKGEDTYRLSFFLSPANIEGTGFLTYDYREPGRDDDQWLYLPELRKIKRIASSDKSSSFMGTDFSYADMTKRVLDEWTYKYLKEAEVRGAKCWLVQALPKNRQVAERYGYTKSVLFVRQDNYMMVRAVHWVKEGNKLKYFDMPRLAQVDGIWTPMEITMKTVKSKEVQHRTVLTYHDVRYGQDLEFNMFSLRTLEKGP
jgi:hypothetical protein